jgi:hypothetical protein
MVLGIICGVVIVGAGLVIAIRRAYGRPSPQERVVRAYHAATSQVEEVLHDARIRMEEAAGRRRPGEQRIGDGIYGS